MLPNTFRTADELTQILGAHMRDLRLGLNRTQSEIAKQSQTSLTAIRNLENGKGTLHTFVAVLRCLDSNSLDALLNLVAPPSVSPMQMLKLQGKKRERAGVPRTKGA